MWTKERAWSEAGTSGRVQSEQGQTESGHVRRAKSLETRAPRSEESKRTGVAKMAGLYRKK